MLIFYEADVELFESTIKEYPDQIDVEVLKDVIENLYLSHVEVKNKDEQLAELLAKYKINEEVYSKSRLYRKMENYRKLGIDGILDHDEIFLSYLKKYPYICERDNIKEWTKRSFSEYYNNHKPRIEGKQIKKRLSVTKAGEILNRFFNETVTTAKENNAIVLSYELCDELKNDKVEHKSLFAQKQYEIISILDDEKECRRRNIRCASQQQIEECDEQEIRRINIKYIANALIDVAYTRMRRMNISTKIFVLVKHHEVQKQIDQIIYKTGILQKYFDVIEDVDEKERFLGILLEE